MQGSSMTTNTTPDDCYIKIKLGVFIKLMLEVSLYWACVKSYRSIARVTKERFIDFRFVRLRCLRFRCKGLGSKRFLSSVGCFIMHFMLEALIPWNHRSLLLGTGWLLVLLLAVEG